MLRREFIPLRRLIALGERQAPVAGARRRRQDSDEVTVAVVARSAIAAILAV